MTDNTKVDRSHHKSRRLRGVLSAIAAMLVANAAPVIAQDNGNGSATTAGFKFLTLGQGAAAMALGETVVARTGDPYVIGYNPGGLTDVVKTQWAATSNSYLQSATGYSSAIAAGGATWGFGARLVSFKVDGIPLRTGPSSEPLGLFEASSFAFGLAGARRVSDDASIGLSADIVAERIDGLTASAFTFALGGQWQIRSDLRLGASLANMGPQASFKTENFDMPMTFRLGAVWDPPVDHDADLAVELVSPNDEDVMWHFGGRYTLRSVVILRAGVIAGHDTRTWSAGLGLSPGKRLDWLRLDYAYVPFKDDLGDTHRFGANFTL